MWSKVEREREREREGGVFVRPIAPVHDSSCCAENFAVWLGDSWRAHRLMCRLVFYFSGCRVLQRKNSEAVRCGHVTTLPIIRVCAASFRFCCLLFYPFVLFGFWICGIGWFEKGMKNWNVEAFVGSDAWMSSPGPGISMTMMTTVPLAFLLCWRNNNIWLLASYLRKQVLFKFDSL